MEPRIAPRKTSSFWRSRIALVILLLCAVLMAIGFARAYVKDYERIKEIQALQDEAARLASEKLSLTQLLSYVETDAFVEEEARTKLQYKKPGEQVIVFSDSTQRAATSTHLVSENNFVRWWHYFFGRKNQ